MPPITTTPAPNPPHRRRSGREGPRELTAAFRRYVERVQAVENPTPQHDLEAALVLAQEIMGHRRGAAVDATLADADYEYQKALLAFWTARAEYEKSIGLDK